MAISTGALRMERLTVDLPAQDYAELKLVAAAGGRGSSMTAIVRRLVHEYLNASEDAADLALVAERTKDNSPLLTSEQVDKLLAERRKARK